MSITNYRSVQQINDTANKALIEAKEEFRSEVSTLKQDQATILQEARRVLEQYAVEKLSNDIQSHGE